MGSRFVLCPECHEAYRALRLESTSSYSLNVMPLGTLVWPDEHPEGGMPLEREGPHKECRASLIRLANARTLLWRSGSVPEGSMEVWEEARRVLPDWPGFHRLTLSPEQMSSLDGCADELDDFLGAVTARFPNVTITDDGSGVTHFRAQRSLDLPVRHPALNRALDIAARVIGALLILLVGLVVIRGALRWAGVLD